MINPKNHLFLLVLLLLIPEMNAQPGIDSLRQANEFRRIAVKDLLGTWQPADSITSQITFVQEGAYSVYIEGVRHGVGNYRFIVENDSIQVNGYAANWPPYYCILHLIDSNTLDFKFYQFFEEEAHQVIFERK